MQFPALAARLNDLRSPFVRRVHACAVSRVCACLATFVLATRVISHYAIPSALFARGGSPRAARFGRAHKHPASHCQVQSDARTAVVAGAAAAAAPVATTNKVHKLYTQTAHNAIRCRHSHTHTNEPTPRIAMLLCCCAVCAHTEPTKRIHHQICLLSTPVLGPTDRTDRPNARRSYLVKRIHSHTHTHSDTTLTHWGHAVTRSAIPAPRDSPAHINTVTVVLCKAMRAPAPRRFIRHQPLHAELVRWLGAHSPVCRRERPRRHKLPSYTRRAY